MDRKAEENSLQDFSRAQAECLTEAGFPATYDPTQGSVEVHHGGRVEESRLAAAVCTEEFGGYPTEAPISDEELAAFYDLHVEAYQCLVDHGYTPVPPSTKEQFVATYLSGESWYSHLSPVPETTIPDTECPQPALSDIEW